MINLTDITFEICYNHNVDESFTLAHSVNLELQTDDNYQSYEEALKSFSHTDFDFDPSSVESRQHVHQMLDEYLDKLSVAILKSE